jgi:hypothetical protein
MNRSSDPSPDPARTRRLALMAAAPLAVLAFAVYAYTGLHTEADAGAKPSLARAAPSAATKEAPAFAPANVDDATVPSQQDSELLAFHPHGG